MIMMMMNVMLKMLLINICQTLDHHQCKHTLWLVGGHLVGLPVSLLANFLIHHHLHLHNHLPNNIAIHYHRENQSFLTFLLLSTAILLTTLSTCSSSSMTAPTFFTWSIATSTTTTWSHFRCPGVNNSTICNPPLQRFVASCWSGKLLSDWLCDWI